MHMLFTNEELKWIDTKTFGWPIKRSCPKDIRENIEKKIKIISSQKALNGAIIDDRILHK